MALRPPSVTHRLSSRYRRPESGGCTLFNSQRPDVYCSHRFVTATSHPLSGSESRSRQASPWLCHHALPQTSLAPHSLPRGTLHRPALPVLSVQLTPPRPKNAATGFRPLANTRFTRYRLSTPSLGLTTTTAESQLGLGSTDHRRLDSTSRKYSQSPRCRPPLPPPPTKYRHRHRDRPSPLTKSATGC